MNKFIFSVFIIVFLLKTGNVFSKTKLFDVDNIVINNEKSLSRESLLNKAFIKGFQKLVNKILLNNDAISVSRTNLLDIKKLISTYQIIENKELIKKNKIKINLSFNREKINDFFYKKNISYAEIYKTDVVLFPLLIKDNNFFIYSDNYFFNNWNHEKNEYQDEFINYILPLENIEDIQFINENKNNLDTLKIENLLSNYDIKDYIFLIITHNDTNFDIFLKSSLSENNIIKNFKLSYNEISKYNYEDAILKIRSEISEIWKSQNLIDVSTPAFLNIKLDINKKNDLLELQKALDQIDLIENYQVLELNKDYAKIKIKYLGKIDRMKLKFNQVGINVFEQNNQWKLKLI